jgi:hypothetical protein
VANSRPKSAPTLPSLALVIVAANQDFTFSCVIGLAHNAFLLHALHDRSGSIVTDLEPALNVAGRCLAVAQDDRNGLAVEIARFRGAHAARVEHRAVLALLAKVSGDGVKILRRALGLEVANDLLHFLIGYEWPVDATDTATALHIKHVALAEQLLGSLLAQDRSAVDLGGHLEGNAGREIRLDGAGDDIDRGALRRQNDVDAGRPRHLRQALDRALDVLARDHHQIGHLVHNHHDIRQRLEVELLLLVDRLAALAVIAGVDGAR